MATNKKIFFTLISGIILLFLSQQAYATPSHVTAKWQDIASVVWSTDQANWGNDAVEVGDTVYFKFVMHKNYLGNHYADLLKTWIDWDQDGQYEESESLFFSELVGSPLGVDDTNTYVNESFDFYSTGFTLTSSNIGEIDILTRVTCSESLLLAAGLGTSWNDQWNFSMSQYNSYFNSDGRLVQGELQYNTLVVNPSSDPIPEPTTMLLFGAGLVAFAGFAQRKRNLNKKG